MKKNLVERIKELIDDNKYLQAKSIINRNKTILSPVALKEIYYLYYDKAKRLYEGNFRGKTTVELLETAISLRNTYQANTLLGDIYIETDIKKAKTYYEEAERGLVDILKHAKKAPKVLKRLNFVREKISEISKKQEESKPKKKETRWPVKEQDIISLANIYATGAQVSRAENELKKVSYDENNLDLQEVYLKIEYVKGDFKSAEERIERILDLDLPNDKYINLVIKLSRLCVKDERFQDAFYMLRVLYKKFPKNSEVICEIINFYITTKNYEHALFIIENYSHDFDSHMRSYVEKALYYLRYMLGIQNIVNEESRQTESYFERQVREYSDKKCIEYHDLSNKDVDRTSLKPVLNCKAGTVYNRLSERIVNLKPVYRGLTDIYVVDLKKELGQVYRLKTTMFEVETISNTKDILTFRPIGREYRETGFVKKMS